MIWVDVTDVVHRLGYRTAVTGIQRVVLELLKILHRHPDVRLCAFSPTISAFVELTFADLLRGPPPPSVTERLESRVKKTGRSLIPKPIRRRIIAPPPSPAASTLVATFGEGDILAAFGAFWFAPEHSGRLIRACFVHRMKLAVLVYDLIVVRHPEWFGSDHCNRWAEQIEDLLRQAAYVFTISNFVASDINLFAQQRRIAPPAIAVLELGDTTFDEFDKARNLPRPRDPYVLTVGSIDIRKNQISLLPVWSRLMRDLGEKQAPTLVIVGDNGTRAAEFWAALAQSPDLKDKVAVLSHVDDRQLAGHYQDALFTIFPSLAEGWGFPVAESLAFGKACIASNVDSLREVGGDLACYIDPRDLESIYDRVKTFVVDAGERTSWENRIRSEYRRRTWQATANSLLKHLIGELPAGNSE